MQDSTILRNNFLSGENINYLCSILPMYGRSDIIHFAVEYSRDIYKKDFMYLYDNNNEYLSDLELSALNLDFYDAYSTPYVKKQKSLVKQKLLEFTFCPKGFGHLNAPHKPSNIDIQKYDGIPPWKNANRWKLPAPHDYGRRGMAETEFIMNGRNQKSLINRYKSY